LDVFTQITIEKVKADLDPKDKRQIVVTLIIRIFVKVTEAEPKQLLIDLPGAKNRFTREQVKLDIVKAIGSRQVAVSDQIDILQLFQGQKPCPKEIIDTIADVTINKKEVINDKVIVEGILTIQIIYVADFPTQPVHHAHIEVAFTEFVEVPGARPGDMVTIQVAIEDVHARVKNECEIAVTAVLAVRAKVMEQIKKLLVAWIDDNLLACLLDANAIRQVTLFLDQILNEEDQVQVTLREVVSIPKPKPDVQKVLEAFVTDLKVTETEVIKNKVIVRGVVIIKVTYVADRPDQPVHAFEAEIPFTAFIEVLGAEPGADVNVLAEAEFVSASMDTARTVAVKLVIKVIARVTDIEQRKVFECLRPSAEIECPIKVVEEVKVPEKKPAPTGKTYVIQAGDTFFKLAQRFGTTVQALRAANPGVNPNNLQIGQVINLP
jgi:LysM repeat protein